MTREKWLLDRIRKEKLNPKSPPPQRCTGCITDGVFRHIRDDCPLHFKS